jgi:hypothetical protein
MVNYQNGKIYKIEDNTNGNVYIGSTCEKTLARRLAGHVGQYKLYLKGKCYYVSSFDIIKNNDYKIVLIEKYQCESKDELFARERHYTNLMGCVNQVKNQGLTLELGNVEYNKINCKKYYEINKTELNEKHQTYNKENKDKIREYQKKYNQDNLETIKERQNKKHNCECGGRFTHNQKLRHMKTKRHLAFLEQNKSSELIEEI